MDRDCSGEITIDEAMTTLFERQGAHNLGDVTLRARPAHAATHPAHLTFQSPHSGPARCAPTLQAS